MGWRGAGSGGARGRRILLEGAAVVKCSSHLPSPAPRETSDPCIHGSDDGSVMRRAPLEGFVFGGGDQLEGLVAGVPEW